MSDSARPATAAILTLGCKLNIADSEAIARRLRDAGWQITSRADAESDAVIVNTCSVTSMADQKSRHLMRAARRTAPHATIALTGCMLETASAETIDALGADIVRRQVEQTLLADQLIALRPIAAPAVESSPPARTLKTRAFVSVQEGCNDLCAFCIIPKTRGRERSKPVDVVVEEVLAREAEGVQEVVITGTQLGAYGRDWGHRTPYQLIEALVRRTSVPRIRMSSVQPQDLSPELIDLWAASPRLCRHFHLALQSGSAGTLQRMRRRYGKQQFAEAVELLRERIPGVSITTDVIVGFPGETDEEFAESLAFCEEMAFAAVHVFPYSQRTGTVAYRMAGQVPDPTIKRRVKTLIEATTEMSRRFREAYIGTEVSILWENAHDGAWEGLTDTYVRVRAASSADLKNRITPARVTGLHEEVLQAEVPA